MTEEEKKQACKEWALAYEERTGKFPITNDWIVRLHPDNRPPYGTGKLYDLFGNYNTFREFCGKGPKNPGFSTLKKAFENQMANRRITETGCWISTTLTPQPGGYVSLGWKKKKFLLHIVSYLYHRDGDVVPESYKNRDVELVRHMCPKTAGENRACFNPDHLEPGTSKDNANDALSYHAGVIAYGKVYEILCEHDENIAAGSGIMDSYRA